MPTSGAGCQLLERSRRRSELTPNPRHLKYESYSKPEGNHFRLRIIWLLSIVPQPLQPGSRSNGWWTTTELSTIYRWLFWYWNFKQNVRCISTLSRDYILLHQFRISELSQYYFQSDSWLTKLLFMKNNDEFTKSWVRTCPPFEHYPDWKAFRPMLSGEIPLSKRPLLG